MQWSEMLADRTLADLPYKIEQDRWGNIVMSPSSNRHGRLQVVLAALFEHLPQGQALIECSIATAEGVKVADVAWGSQAFFDRHGYTTPYPQAPELCVEIRSPSNSMEEMEWKSRLYLAAGACEVWVVSEEGGVRYFGTDGELASSRFDIDPAPLLGH